ncbi:TATA-box-binding protein [Halalkalicoccus ordinarius]|uniref:TATA-box-binding protein n=1 Tax=Halalkalicoccus ordinarius TaxID=3116651 RepID=UPI00300F2B6C
MIKVVNVVASGSLGLELDLVTIEEELSDIVDYDPEMYPGAYIHLGESYPLVTIYRTGKYIITGADSKAEADSTRDTLLNLLSDHKILPAADDDWFAIQNYVCMGDIRRELDLDALVIDLGLEISEYEPEQFPGIVYRPPNHNCVLLIFRSGKVIITGGKDIDSSKNAFSTLYEHINNLFRNDSLD